MSLKESAEEYFYEDERIAAFPNREIRKERLLTGDQAIVAYIEEFRDLFLKMSGPRSLMMEGFVLVGTQQTIDQIVNAFRSVHGDDYNFRKRRFDLAVAEGYHLRHGPVTFYWLDQLPSYAEIVAPVTLIDKSKEK
jgi:hypothetical protein